MGILSLAMIYRLGFAFLKNKVNYSFYFYLFFLFIFFFCRSQWKLKSQIILIVSCKKILKKLISRKYILKGIY